jgi:hypothetical protein
MGGPIRNLACAFTLFTAFGFAAAAVPDEVQFRARISEIERLFVQEAVLQSTIDALKMQTSSLRILTDVSYPPNNTAVTDLHSLNWYWIREWELRSRSLAALAKRSKDLKLETYNPEQSAELDKVLDQLVAYSTEGGSGNHDYWRPRVATAIAVAKSFVAVSEKIILTLEQKQGVSTRARVALYEELFRNPQWATEEVRGEVKKLMEQKLLESQQVVLLVEQVERMRGLANEATRQKTVDMETLAALKKIETDALIANEKKRSEDAVRTLKEELVELNKRREHALALNAKLAQDSAAHDMTIRNLRAAIGELAKVLEKKRSTGKLEVNFNSATIADFPMKTRMEELVKKVFKKAVFSIGEGYQKEMLQFGPEITIEVSSTTFDKIGGGTFSKNRFLLGIEVNITVVTDGQPQHTLPLLFDMEFVADKNSISLEKIEGEERTEEMLTERLMRTLGVRLAALNESVTHRELVQSAIAMCQKELSLVVNRHNAALPNP